jgi:hypothetical protein
VSATIDNALEYLTVQNQLNAAITSATNAQTVLVNAINTTASQLDTIGSADLDGALERLADSIDGVKRRLQIGRSAALSLLAGLVEDLDCFAGEVTAPAVVSLPAPSTVAVAAVLPISQPQEQPSVTAGATIPPQTTQEPTVSQESHTSENSIVLAEPTVEDLRELGLGSAAILNNPNESNYLREIAREDLAVPEVQAALASEVLTATAANSPSKDQGEAQTATKVKGKGGRRTRKTT